MSKIMMSIDKFLTRRIARIGDKLISNPEVLRFYQSRLYKFGIVLVDLDTYHQDLRAVSKAYVRALSKLDAVGIDSKAVKSFLHDEGVIVELRSVPQHVICKPRI